MRNQTLNELRRINAYLSKKYPVKPDNGLGAVGLILSKSLNHETYSTSPENVLRFAKTGGNGVHFGLYEGEGGITDNSPVVMTTPMYFGETDAPHESNVIVGENLRCFLEFGLYLGYFAFEQLSYDLQGSLRDRQNEQNSIFKRKILRLKYGIGKAENEILTYMAKELSLQPRSYSITEFKKLQLQYMPALRYAPEQPIEYPPGFWDD